MYIYILAGSCRSIPSTYQFCVLAVALQDAVRPGVRRKSFRQCSSVMKQSCCTRQFVLAFFMSTLYLQLVRASTWRSLGDHLAITWSNNWSSLGVHLEATWRSLGDHLEATWRPLGGHLKATWRPFGGHLKATWRHLESKQAQETPRSAPRAPKLSPRGAQEAPS